jgi:2-(1,2-epoxy-1,2-dihydrophenyl)acetyl-CoA isomerase
VVVAAERSPRQAVSVLVNQGDDRVAVVQFDNPPYNYFDIGMLRELADVYERLGAEHDARAIVLCSDGRHFCAGADFGEGKEISVQDVYAQAYRMFKVEIPVVAAVQGAAVGGGLGLALSADFRVATANTRFQANFARLGIHHGFGLTVTLPAVVGDQRAQELLYLGRSVKGEEALGMQLCDRLAPTEEELRPVAHGLAAELAGAAPLALHSIRTTMRGDLAERVRLATEHEASEQTRLFGTEDFREGVKATSERRAPEFSGR